MNISETKKELDSILRQDISRSQMIDEIISLVETILNKDTSCGCCGNEQSAVFCEGCTKDKESEAREAGYEEGCKEGYEEGCEEEKRRK